MKKIATIFISFIVSLFIFIFLLLKYGENNIASDSVAKTGFIFPFSISGYNSNGEIEVLHYYSSGVAFNTFIFITLNFLVFNYFLFLKNINYHRYLFMTLLFSLIYVLFLSVFENFVRASTKFFLIEVFYQVRGTYRDAILNNTLAVFVFIVLSIFSFYLVLLCMKLYNFIKESIEKRT